MHFTEAKSLLSGSNGMNVYRGCTHGCIYCDSRSRCYGFTHCFEDIEVKRNAPELLEKALTAKRRKCMIGTGSMCDPYLHAERELRLTRRCLEIIDKYGFGVSILTKSASVLRDLDLLASINEKAKAVVQMTVTTADRELCGIIEPNVSDTDERFEALLKLRDAGIPTMVWLSPLLPYINDTEENIRSILERCAGAGVKGIVCFGMGLTLREGNREYFYQALDRHFKGMKELYIKEFGNSYEILSPDNDRLMRLFREECRKYGMMSEPGDCFAYMKELPEKYEQMSMFGI